MFCPNCGTNLVKLNQRFCHICGMDLAMIYNRPQLRPERSQDATIAKSQVTPVYTSLPVSQQELVKERKIGPYSKRCLAFSIVSCAIPIFCVFSGGIILLVIILSRNALVALLGFLLSVSVNCVGLIFGILSRVNNTQAGRSEPSNSLKKVGSVFGIHGIIFNSIELGLALLIMGLAIAFGTL